MATVSEYEAKRLRRMEENRLKLQSLQLPLLIAQKPLTTTKKRKREVEEKLLEPTRKSSRMRKKRKLEKKKLREERNLRKLEKAQLRMEKSARKLEKQKRREEKELRKKEKMERKRCKFLAKLEFKKIKFERNMVKRKKKAEQEQEEKQKKWKEHQEKMEQRKRDLDTKVKEKMVELYGPPLQTQPRINDWRLRRKLFAQEERRRFVMRKRFEKKELRLQEKIKEKKRRLRKRELEKRERRKARSIKLLHQMRDKERLRMERDDMRREDHLARELVRQEKREERRKQFAIEDKETLEKVFQHSKRLREEAKEEHEELYKQKYPIRKCEGLPFVQMSGTIQPTAKKPLVVTPLLKIDTTLFHSFSLGKQFLPPGKESVMQALCPGGYTPLFAEDSDIHIWNNGMALFLPCSTGMYMEYLFREARLGKKKMIMFPWRRCREVTPFHLWHLSQVQRGEEAIRCSDNYYLAPFPPGKPLPLLLFVQYPDGPYVYFGRLGYLGYTLAPDIEFSFQLLDIATLNWQKMRRLFVSADKKRVWPEVLSDDEGEEEDDEDEIDEQEDEEDEDEEDDDEDDDNGDKVEDDDGEDENTKVTLDEGE